MNLTNIAILNNKSSDYCCITSLIRKNEAINLLQNVKLQNCKKWNIINEKNIEKFESIYKNRKSNYKIW